MIKKFVMVILLLQATLLLAGCRQPGPYSAKADPKADFERALGTARADDKWVLLVFGANWCPDCRSLDDKFQQVPLAETIGNNFQTVYVDVGNFDRNTEFTANFGQPTRGGIPSIAIVNAAGELRYVAEAGEFASARHAKLHTLNDWFERKLTELRN